MGGGSSSILGAVGAALSGRASDALRSAVRWGALLLVALVALSAHTAWKQRKARRRLEAQCSAAGGDATIFVALLGEHGSQASAQALFALLDGAACPRRVRVGLYEILDASSGDALHMYRGMTERYSALGGTGFADRVTVMRRLADDQGPYGALWELLTHAYGGEAHVLTLSDAVQMQRGWDTKLLEVLARAPSPERTCLVLPPHGGFPVTAGFEDGLPTVGTRPWAALDGAPLPRVKFWMPSASFAPAGMWRGSSGSGGSGSSGSSGSGSSGGGRASAVPCRRDALRHLNAGTELLVTADAMAAGWSLRSPAKLLPALVWGNPEVPASAWAGRSTKASRHAAAAARAALYSQPLAPALLALSLHASVGRDALMGVVDARDEDEVAAKYASVAEFLYLASKITPSVVHGDTSKAL